MRQGKRSFRYDSLQDSETIQEILKSVVKGMAKGKIVFSDEENEITMEPEGLLRLRLSASQDEGRHRINIRVSWLVEEEVDKGKKQLSVQSK